MDKLAKDDKNKEMVWKTNQQPRISTRMILSSTTEKTKKLDKSTQMSLNVTYGYNVNLICFRITSELFNLMKKFYAC